MNEEPNIKQLPKEWTWTRLGDLVDNPKQDLVDGPFGSNLKSEEYIESGIPVFKIQNIKVNRFVEKHMSFISEAKAKTLIRHSFQTGDLIITKLGEPLGLCCKVPTKYPFGIIVADLMRLRPSKTKIYDDYLINVINSDVVKKQFKSITKGTTRARVNLTIVRDIKIPLPPKATQQAIVSKIEELFSELDKGTENLRIAQQQLKTYRQAVLKWAFEGKLTHENVKQGELPKGWRLALLNEVAKIKGGKRLPPKHQYSEEPTDFVYIMAGNLKNGTVRNKSTYIREETYNALANYKVTGGEVYITIVGACIGDAGIIPENIGKSILTENAAKIIELKDTYYKYLALWINSTSCQSTIKSKILSATLGKLALNRIGTLEVPLPPIEEQHKIVQEIESRLSVADKMEESITQSLQQAEALRQSILKKAFEGRLI